MVRVMQHRDSLTLCNKNSPFSFLIQLFQHEFTVSRPTNHVELVKEVFCCLNKKRKKTQKYDDISSLSVNWSFHASNFYLNYGSLRKRAILESYEPDRL